MKAILNLLLGLLAIVSIAGISDIHHSENALKPPKIEQETALHEEIVTGVCDFGGCPGAIPTTTEPETTTEVTTKTQTKAKPKQTESYTEYRETKPDTEDSEPDTEAVTEQEQSDATYLGTFWITGYTAEEGFPEGSATASGCGVRPGYCAMNADHRWSLGIRYGDQIYVEGMGTYTVMDSGCDWGVVDIWVYSNAEAYNITGFREVWLY